MQDNLRTLIRALIEQELSALKTDNSNTSARKQSPDFRKSAPTIRKESVRLSSNEDVAAFVQRILKLTEKQESREALESGQHRFQLTTDRPAATRQNFTGVEPESHADEVSTVDHGLLTERECRRLASNLQVLIIGRTVRVTPLAADWLRRKGITIKRAVS